MLRMKLIYQVYMEIMKGVESIWWRIFRIKSTESPASLSPCKGFASDKRL